MALTKAEWWNTTVYKRNYHPEDASRLFKETYGRNFNQVGDDVDLNKPLEEQQAFLVEPDQEPEPQPMQPVQQVRAQPGPLPVTEEGNIVLEPVKLSPDSPYAQQAQPIEPEPIGGIKKNHLYFLKACFKK